MKSKFKAFTLIEIMIVAVVAAILIAASLPNSDSAKKQDGLEIVARFEADVAYAQSLSISRPDDPIVIRVDVARDGYWLAHKSDPSTPIKHPGTGRPYIVTGGSNANATFPEVDFIATNFGDDNMLGFNSSGGIDQEETAYFRVKSGDNRYQAEISSTTGQTDSGRDPSAAASGSSNTNTNSNTSGGEEKDEGVIGSTVDGVIRGLGGL